MAYSFTGTNLIQATLASNLDSGDWTAAIWFFLTASSPATSDRLFHMTDAGGAQKCTIRCDAAASRQLRIIRNHVTTNASTLTTSSLATNTWTLLVVTFRTSDSKLRAFTGTVTTGVAELAYTTQTAGVGGVSTGMNTMNIGNVVAGTAPWEGSLYAPVIDNREWSTADMNAYRLGVRPWITGNIMGLWPFENDGKDLSGNGADGTVTGATVVADPAVGYEWQKKPPVRKQMPLIRSRIW